MSFDRQLALRPVGQTLPHAGTPHSPSWPNINGIPIRPTRRIVEVTAIGRRRSPGASARISCSGLCSVDTLLRSRIPLISPKEFPAPLFREFSRNQLNERDISVQRESKFPANHEKFPANSRISGNFRSAQRKDRGIDRRCGG
jgi:hypothetical protein